MRCAIYRRVSTDEQAEKGFSLENQRIRLESFATSQEWKVVADYLDDGYSAKNIDRPALKQMMKDAKENKFDLILVYKLDRFTRSVRDLNDLLETIQECNVSFKSATESIDTSTATGRMILNMIGTTAQWERETISERIKDVLSKMRENGIFPTGKAPFGYKLGSDRKIIQVPQEVEVVKFIYSKARTHGQRQIAKLLREQGVKTYHGSNWLGSNVGRVLHNPFYCGYLRVSGELVPVKNEGFEPIVTLSEFMEVAKVIRKRSMNSTRSRSETIYPFSGIVLCPSCGGSMRGDKLKKKLATGETRQYYYYRCGNAKNHLCDQKAITANKIDVAFSEYITGAFKNATVQTTENNFDRQAIDNEINTLNRKVERMKELYIEGDIPKDKYNERLKKFRDQQEDLKTLLLVEDNTETEQIVIDSIRKLESVWCLLDDETKANALRPTFDTLTIEQRGKDIAITGHKLL
ncbi:recombinase family protein [Bacillus sp. Fil]|uniref:recombinase family protein n=1 Tax=Bacillus sp. Fil TaxID=3459567 RepID=UPI00403B16C2